MAKGKSEAEVVFKASDNGLRSTLKDITLEMQKNNAESKLVQAQLKLTGSDTEKLSSQLSSLEKSYDLQSQKIQVTSERLENAKKYYGENSTEVQRLEKELLNQQTAQQKTANEISNTEKALSESKGEIKSYASVMKDLDNEQKEIQASASLAESEYRKWQATAGKTATESEKFAKAQEFVAQQSEFAEQKLSVMERQLEAAKQEFGENSLEAKQMQAALNDAETEFHELGEAAEEASGKGTLEEIGSKIDLGNLQNAADHLSEIGEKIVDVGKYSLEAFNQVDEGLDTIVTKTGASSKQMEGYEAIYRKIGSDMPVELGKVGEAIGEVNTQLGFQGDELESASRQAIKFAEINGQDITSSVIDAKQAISAYKLENKDFSMVLDTVTKVAQDTGQATGDLFKKAIEGAPQIKALGLSFQDGVTLMGNFEKAGVDSGAALSSLSKASVVYAKDGKTLEQGLQGTVKSIQNAKSETDALTIASEVFGTKGAVRMVDAIKRGTFSLGEFGKASEDSVGKVSKTYEDTLDPIDELEVAQNNLTMTMADFGATLAEVLAPILQSVSDLLKGVSGIFSGLSTETQQMIVIIGGLATGFMLLSPFIVSIITLFSSLGGLFAAGGLLAGVGTFFTATLLPALPIIAAVAAAIGAAILIFKNWGTITDWISEKWSQFTGFLSDLWTGIKNTAENVWNGLKAFFQTTVGQIALFIINPIAGLVNIIAQNWEAIKKGASSAWTWIKNTVSNLITGTVNIAKNLWSGLINFLSNLWTGAKNTASNLWNGIKSVISNAITGAKNSVSNIANTIKSTIGNIWSGIKNTTSNVWNSIKSAIISPIESAKNTVGGIIDRIKGLFNFRLSFPSVSIPHIPLPHFSMSGSINPLSDNFPPRVSVSWYAKGGIFTKPSIFGMANGNLLGAGDAGPEAALPLNRQTLGDIGRGIVNATPILQGVQGNSITNDSSSVVFNITNHVDSGPTADSFFEKIDQWIANKSTQVNFGTTGRGM
ncbi:phage tail tape measure protein [Enterococcus dispar]|uniref:Phage tail tape measure protein, TP901 family, core region n=1 Tax=Enterococcus dispar ATCC 51266 TaxID=1139219 RepID=S0KR35_9ENTE|nr:phage tail tape measure protein [Enterococcus dispar]EOT42598.1 phage tail tape measure protein, TP901 family, core region [Enterococcus dispar ATCC 51266]EOW84951.1 phage tail tape measure protein, TP901 family, core region [Enterococcus dispar ATCC 51266]OJG37667.1 phage tail tape measure protein, TP901 family, core region [Enterococcus dispar]